MPAPDTHPTLFVTTRWTVVCHAAHGGDTGASEALGALFAACWPPLYRYVRRLGLSPEGAQDSTQEFSAGLLANCWDHARRALGDCREPKNQAEMNSQR